jgi:hypothetical protein
MLLSCSGLQMIPRYRDVDDDRDGLHKMIAASVNSGNLIRMPEAESLIDRKSQHIAYNISYDRPK